MKSEKTTKLKFELDTLDVIDFPIALNDFIKYREQSLIITETNSGLGYWQRQKEIQYNQFSTSTISRVKTSKLPE